MTVTHPGDRAPPGFRALPHIEGFIGSNGPLYVDQSGPAPVLGFRVHARHCNPMGVCHGGWIATVMDMALTLTARLTIPDLHETFLLTVNMAVDYLGGAPLDAWVEGRGQVLKRTGRMVFVQALLSVDGVAVARGNGTFRIGRHGAPIISEA